MVHCYTRFVLHSNILFESSDLCDNTRACLDPQLKITVRWFRPPIVNEVQSTDTTLVHKHEQQIIKVKHKSKGK